MTLKSYIWGMRIITLLSLAALGSVVFYVDPYKSGLLGIMLFYLVALFTLSGIFNLFLIFLRRTIMGNEVAAESAGLSFRQGILLASASLGILLLQNFRMLIWWDGLLVLAGAFIVELFFLSRS